MTMDPGQLLHDTGNGGVWKLLRHNRLFVLTLVTMITAVGASLYFGTRQIYQEEASRLHQLTVARVEATKNSVRVLFANLAQDLMYLKGLEEAEAYAAGAFPSGSAKETLTLRYQQFLDTHAHYLRLAVYDRHGESKLDVTCSKLSGRRAGENSANSPERNPPSPSQLKKNGIWVSPVSPPPTGAKAERGDPPEISLSAALPARASRQPVGYLTMYLSIAAVTEVLQQGVFLQTREGLLIEPSRKGPPTLKEAEYKLVGDSGWMPVSDVVTIHYRSFEFLPGERIFAVAYHHHPQLGQSLHRMTFWALALLAGFATLSAVVGVATFSRYSKLVRAQRGMIFSLAGLADGRDPETGDHLERTRRYAVHLARELKKSKEFANVITNDFLDDLYTAAPLHDIGKVGIPDAILLKPGGLNDEEYEVMKTHVLVARKVLNTTIQVYGLNEPVFFMGLNIATHHHERFDGKGYPDGLSGETIPLEARIFALCDAYDAIRSKRPYKGTVTHEEAMQRILKDSGTHFDPRIVQAFVACERDFKTISQEIE